jgi:hypothetical protein
VPEDNQEFQGWLEEEAPFPDVSAKLPGVILEEEEEGDYQVVTDKPKPAFKTIAAAALENTGIDATKQIQVARAAANAAAGVGVMTAQPNSPHLIEQTRTRLCKKSLSSCQMRELSWLMTTWKSFRM